MADIFETDAWIALLEFTLPMLIIATAGTISERRDERRERKEEKRR